VPSAVAAPARLRAARQSFDLSDEDFQAIAALVRKEAGIVLNASKRDLVFGRLNRRLRVLGVVDFATYRTLLEGPNGADERREMLNALTTNLTSFFRELHHFTYLANHVLPDLLGAVPRRRVRLWSAACSSGEEPYSIAMVVHKALQGRDNADVRILATDIDTNMVQTAAQGIYPAARAASIPSDYARMRVPEAGDTVSMPDAIRQYITFNQLNLLEPWPMQGSFDVIFCRNVVIYFDKDTQRKLFDRMADVMTAGGILFIGHSETLFRVSDRFANLGHTTYRKIR
jgi:chemotaxis protein methyltransferase CheR